MPKFFSMIFALLTSGAAAAHDFEDVEVTRVTYDGQFIVIFLDDTVNGVRLSCAVYDADDVLIDARTLTTNNLATRVTIITTQRFTAPVTARCVLN